MPTGAARVLPHVGALVEGPAFHPYLSGRDNLHAPGRGGPVGAGRQGARAGRPRPWTGSGLSAAARKKYRAYSLGMRQRLGLAGALLRPRELFVLDEPTNGLDPQGTREVRSLVHEVAAEGATVFVSSHLLSEIEQMCTHVGVMSRGRLVFQGSLSDLGSASSPRVRVQTSQPAEAVGVMAAVGLSSPSVVDGQVVAELGVGRQCRGHRRSGRRRGPRAAAGRRAAGPRGAVRRPDRGGLRCRPVS